MRDCSTPKAPPTLWIAVIFAAVVSAMILQQSPPALVFLLTDGAVAAGILLAASLAGLWLVALLRCGDLPLRWQLLLGAGLGVGALALLILVFGLIGWLNRTLWISLLVVMAVSGLPRLVHFKSQISNLESDRPNLATRNSKLAWLWLLAAPFAALTFLVALVPPGLLWAEEGNGYDVLEYHLQMPREYFETGRIAYAPHNVYASFPSNAEMLYLLAMIVQGDPIAGAGVAQLINALLAFLTVAAAWLAGREVSPAVGHATGVLAATCGWLVYLSGVAYVENAMMFFGMLSAAVVGSALRTASARKTGPQCGPYKGLAAAGVLAGFSAGCKYTAVALIVIPLAIAVLIGRWSSYLRRLGTLAVFGLSALAAFAPWMLKNVRFTGNPVFPLAHTLFRAYPEGWRQEDAEHFARCHAPAPEESSAGFRIKMLWEKVIADDAQRFGPAVFVLGTAGLMVRWRPRSGRNRDGNPETVDRDRNLGPDVVLLSQVVLWLAFTHLYARFAVVFLIPLVILAGRFFAASGRVARWAGAAVLIAGAAWNLFNVAELYRRHLYADGQRISIEGTPEAFTNGHMPSYEHLKVINTELPAVANFLLVGEARAFYFLRRVDYRVVFNRDPFIELLKSSPGSEQVRAWLSERGFSHVYAAWSEIRRLSRSRYGFHGLDEAPLRLMLEALETEGALRLTHTFAMPNAIAPYTGLFEVVPRSAE